MRGTWALWTAVAVRLPARPRQSALNVYGPLMLLSLFALWAACLILGLALPGRHVSNDPPPVPGVLPLVRADELHPDRRLDAERSGEVAA